MSILKKFITSYKRQIQKTKDSPYLLLVPLILIFCFPVIVGIAADQTPLKEIKVVSDDNYPPYIFRDGEGRLQGILVDEWRLWEEKAGVKVDLRGMDWGKAQKTMAEGNAQVIDTIFFTEERAKTLAFSAPYASLDVPIFFHSDISGIKDVKSLHGFTIGVKAGDACIDFLKRHGIHTLREYPSYESIVRAAWEQKIRVFCIDAPPAHYYLHKLNLEQQYRSTAPLYTGQFHRAVQKEKKDLLTVVEKGFAKISQKEHEAIEKRWRGSPVALSPYLKYLWYLMGGLVILGVILMLWNYTLRRKVTQKTVQLRETIEGLEKSEKLFRSYLEDAPDGVYMSDLKGTILYGNRKSEEILGYRREELIGKNFLELNLLPEESLNKAAQLLQANSMGKSTGPDEFELISKEGRLMPVEISTSVIQRMGQEIVLAFIRDISERKRAEEALKESENKYRVIAENMTDVITIMDMNLRFTFVSPSIMRLRGFTVEEVMEQSIEQVMTPESLQISAKVFEEEMQREASGTADPGRVRTLELEEYRKDMSTIWVEVSLSFLRDADGQPIGMLSLSRDITTRKHAENALRESEEKYRELVKYAPAGIYEVDYETNRFTSVNDVICEYTGYSRDELSTMNLFNLLTAESQQLMLARLEKLMAGEKLDPTVEYCIRTKDGNELWGLFNARYIYEAGKLKGATGVIYDITARKQTEGRLQETLENLRKAFIASIQLLVSAVEARDPYTAGHQIRSTNLARAIATEMGLPQEKIEGLRMAGSIHDIGKLSIPAEILSKPTKLTNVEFSLIKEHARAGYEMLKDVESPWPLAEIVHQHHERIDGSGYPRQLKGDEILIEARIMAVADVVESMASHRPYRPAIGIEAALEEIKKNKGILYDDAVADACLRLFREKGFKL
jgi:PAS domain S-box-containing protein